MSSMQSRLDYLISALDFHLQAGNGPEDAWEKSLEDYQFVYFVDDGRLEIARAAERLLLHMGHGTVGNV